jgi:cyclase
MLPVRLIPRLDIKGPNVVKGIHLEGLRVIGRPDKMARYYYEAGADELFFMDTVASLYERNSLGEIISKTASEIFIPLTVGGGLRTLHDMATALRAGADKVCLNTAAIKTPKIIKESSRTLGSSTIVVAIEAIREPDGSYLAYTDNGREYTGVDVFEWAKKVEELGAGEIVITSVDKEGTGEGFDLELVQRISENASIPVIAHGGAGNHQHVIDAIQIGKADAVATASVLHYEYVRNNLLDSIDSTEGNTEFIRSGRSFKNFQTSTVGNIKSKMLDDGLAVRI